MTVRARSRGSSREQAQSTPSRPASGADRGNTARQRDLGTSEQGSETTTLDAFASMSGQDNGEPDGGSSPTDLSSAAEMVGRACSLAGGSGADLGTLTLGSTVIARASASAALSGQDGFWFRVQAGTGGVNLAIGANNIDVDLVCDQAEYQGVRVYVSMDCDGAIPAVPPPAPEQAPTPAAERPSRERSRGSGNDASETPWYVLVPVVNLVGIWFWRPVQRASREAAEQSAEQLRLHYVELIAGLVIPIFGGFEIGLNPASAFGAIDAKVQCIQDLTAARTQEEKWQILWRYASQVLARMAVDRISGGLPQPRGSIATLGRSQWIAQNARYLSGEVLKQWLSTAAQNVAASAFGGETQTWEQVRAKMADDFVRSALVAIIGEELGAGDALGALNDFDGVMRGRSDAP